MNKIKLLIEGVRIFKDWHIWLADRFGCVMKQRRFKLRNGIGFFVSPVQQDQVGYFQEIYLQKIYTKNYPVEKLKNGGVVIDLGSNIGVFSLFIASFNPKVKVYSYEPMPRVYKRLIRNIKENKFEKQIFPFRCAVDSKDAQEISLIESGNDLVDDIEFKTPAVTIESIFKENQIERCDFLKMDIEGKEFDVLPTIPQEIWDKIDYVAMEYHGNPEPLKDVLTENGFKVDSDSTTNNCGIIYAKK